MADLPYWKTTPLAAMSDAQWEALCDGCGRCCLHKLRDEDDDILYTEVSCRLLDTHTCGCSDYLNRQAKVPDCVRLTPEELAVIDWLPPTCGYRRIAEGRDLAWWHPLVSGNSETVHEAGISVRGRTVDEREAGMLEDHIVAWPARTPKGAGLRASAPKRAVGPK